MGFWESEIMRSYYKTAKEKGWVQSAIKKEASVKELKSTGNLLVDISTLANELRSKGYEKYAAELEKSVLNYKTAESDLYKLNLETPGDFLEMAHDGDVYIEDAADKMGDVETLISQHKKIVDVVNKEPKGKLAELADSIIRVADTDNENEGIKSAGFLAQAFLKKAQQASLSDFLGKFKAGFDQDKANALFDAEFKALYDFINVYYHEFFKKLWSYRNDALIVYGAPYSTGIDGIEDMLSGTQADSIKYLTNVQTKTGIQTLDLIGEPAEGFWDKATWFFNNKDKIAQALEQRFNQKHNTIRNDINNINASINANIQKAKQNAKNPINIKQMIDNGTYKYLVSAFDAFWPEYKQALEVLFTQVHEIKEEQKQNLDQLDQSKIKASIDRLVQSGHVLIDAMYDNPDIRTKHESTVQYMQGLIDALEDNSGQGWEHLKSSLPQGISYDSFEDLDRDTVELMNLIQQEVGG